MLPPQKHRSLDKALRPGYSESEAPRAIERSTRIGLHDGGRQRGLMAPGIEVTSVE